MTTFNQLGLSPEVLKSVNNMGFEETTPIQREAIPFGLAGRDLIGQARTGTGKTAAFGIPMVERFSPDQGPPQGLVITPTRELAVQVAEELNRIGDFKHIRALPIYGGQDINRQISGLKKTPQIIVGTPGRLLDHIRRRTIHLGEVATVILDEADEMLNMGFIEDIEAILLEVPRQRQTQLYSATMPRPIRELAQKFMREPKLIQTKSEEITVPTVAQSYVEVQENKKFDTLCHLLDLQPPELAIVFGRTKRRVDEIAEGLKSRGYSAEGIHGDLAQARRESVLRQFKSGIVDILVATDVAARGLDITGVSHVYNFDIPQDAEGYVHRIGRTGRAGRSGEAISLVTPREQDHFRYIQRSIGAKAVRTPAPSLTDVMKGQQRQAAEWLLAAAGNGGSGPFRELAAKLLDEHDSIDLLAAALKLLTREPDSTPVRITEESAYRFRQRGEDRSSPRGSQRRSDSWGRRPKGGSKHSR
jgi:ATP-dependent RNA helicase DeaD